MERLAFSVREASKMLGLHVNSVHKLVWRGVLGHVRMGTKILIPRAEIEKFLSGAAKETTPKG